VLSSHEDFSISDSSFFDVVSTAIPTTPVSLIGILLKEEIPEFLAAIKAHPMTPHCPLEQGE
jgi:hypothetical protein